MIQALHHHTGCITEETRLVIIAVCRMALHLEFIPCPSVDSIFLRPQRIELQQNRYRFTRHFPPSNTNRNLHSPLFKKRLILLKVNITVLSEIRSEEEHFIGMFRLHRCGTRTQHRVNTTYAVTYFPTGFKNIIWLHNLIYPLQVWLRW